MKTGKVARREKRVKRKKERGRGGLRHGRRFRQERRHNPSAQKVQYIFRWSGPMIFQ